MNDKPSVMKTVIIEDEKAAVRNLTSPAQRSETGS